MEIYDWIELICSVGTFIFAALTYFNGKKQPSNARLSITLKVLTREESTRYHQLPALKIINLTLRIISHSEKFFKPSTSTEFLEDKR